MDTIFYFLSIYFSTESWLTSLAQGIVFFVAFYGVCKLLLFVIRYYVIYNIAKKLSSMLSNNDKPTEQEATEKEDELLRDEEKEKEEEVEKVKIQVMKKQKNTEQELKFFLPKATGKWQKMILGRRQNQILEVAKRMQAQKTTNFWQIFTQIQKEQSGISKGKTR